MIAEIGPDETARAVAALHVLRPHLTPEALHAQVDRQRGQGYRVVGSFAAGDPDAAAVAGFRLHEWLVSGRTLYVDDLSCRPEHRGAGHAGALLDWLEEEARRAGCQELHLDSGVAPDRADAHRLYLNHRLAVTSLHFAKRLG